MNPHVSELLPAYHDGELPSHRRHQVEKHLQDCGACRAELDALEELSSFVKADVVPPHTSPERFAAQVQLRLPRALPSRTPQKGVKPPLWVLGVPLALTVVWAFLQAALKVTAFVLTTDQLLGGRAAVLKTWLPAQGLLQANTNLLMFNIVFLIGITILWSAWMALWLAWNKNQNELSIKGGVR